MPKVLYSPAAIDDLDDIWLYIAVEANAEAAEKFLQKIENACEKIVLSPVGFRLRPEFAPDLRSFPFGNYIVFYFPENHGINIARVVHAARDIGSVFKG